MAALANCNRMHMRTMVLGVWLAVAAGAPAPTFPKQWTHGWGSVKSLAIAHGSYTDVLSDAAVRFIGQHYQAATFSGCSGASNYSKGGDSLGWSCFVHKFVCIVI